MPVALKHYVCGKGFNTREKVEAEFWRTHEKYNGNRRLNPREFITITRIVMSDINVVHYTVPSRIIREARERRSEAGR